MKNRLSRVLALSMAAFFPLSLLADGLAASEKAAGPVISGGYLFQVLGSLLLVFGCLFGLVFLLKKFNGVALNSQAPVRVLYALRAGTREKILLLEAGEQQLLVGVTPAGIRTLHTFDKPVDLGTAKAGGNGKPSFQALLKKHHQPQDTTS